MSDDFSWPYADREPRVKVLLVSPAGSVSAVELDARPETLTIAGDVYRPYVFQPDPHSEGTIVFAAVYPFTGRVEARLRALLLHIDDPERWNPPAA